MTDPPEAPPRRRPRAFRLDPHPPAAAMSEPRPMSPVSAESIRVEPQVDAYAREAEAALTLSSRDEAALEVAQAEGVAKRSRLTWSGLAWSSAGGLVSLGFGLWVSRLIEDLFSRTAALGWFGVALAALLGAALLAIVAREIFGVFRQNRVARLHRALASARLADDRDAARAHVGELAALYAARPETAAARAEVARAARDIVDGRDLVDIAEHALMTTLDRRVRHEIAAAARRVSLVTTLSPRAIFDVVFVAGQIVVLIRTIAELYSGRPGLLGFLKLARSVGAHLALTGGMALGDSLVQQVVGHGIAARLSARLGEGVLNGLLTTRVGLSAMAVCRPMPFAVARPPGVKDVAPFLFKGEVR